MRGVGRRCARGATAWAFALVVTAVAVLAAPGAVPEAGAAGGSFPLATFRDLVVDPTTGRVFVSGDDEVLAFAPDGSLLATIPDVLGAAGMDVAGGSLWVAATGAAKLARIDIATLTVAQVVTPGVSVDGISLAVLGSGVWFRSGEVLSRWDTTTSTRSDRGNVPPIFERVGTSTTMLLASLVNNTSNVWTVDLTTNPVTVTQTTIAASTVRQLASGPTPGTFVVAGNPITQIAQSTLKPDGSTYAIPQYNAAASVATSPGFGGLVAGTPGSPIYVWKAGVSAPTLTIPVNTSGIVPRGLALSKSGSTAYAVSVIGNPYDTGMKALLAFDLAPTLTFAAPDHVVTAVPGTVTLTGTRLDALTRVTFAGVDVPYEVRSPTTVDVHVPLNAATGTQTVEVTSMFGKASRSITVLPNTGASLAGVVRGGAAPLAGIQVTLTSSVLPAARTTTTDGAGAYALTGLPYGTDYALTAHDPAGARPDQVTRPLTLTPNETRTMDLALAAAAVPGAMRARTPLPITSVRDLEVDAVTGRAFVSGDDEVDAFDASGRLIGRLLGHGEVGDLALDGTNLFVLDRAAKLAVRVDTRTLATTGSWSLPDAPNGSITFAAGKVWFASGTQWSGLRSLDPATGAISASTTGSWYGSYYGARLQRIEGSPNRFYLSNEGLSSDEGFIVDGSGAAPTVLVSGWDRNRGVASLSAGLLWTTDGHEYLLSDLSKSTGINYPASAGSAAYTPKHGGIVAFGSVLVRRGVPVAVLDLQLGISAEAFDAAGDHLFALADGELVVADLRPLVAAVAGPVYTDASTVTVTGSNLLGASGAKVDGTAAVAPSARTDGSVTFPVAGLAAGAHQVTVTTPFGTSAAVAFTAVVRPPAPTITGAAPTSLPTAGGSIAVTGTGFGATTSVTVAGVAVPFTIVSSTALALAVPAHLPAQGPIVVTTPGGSASSQDVRWVAPVPTISGITPARDVVVGGTTATLKGHGLSFASAVSFDGVAATFAAVDDETVTAKVPAHAVGPVDVAVTTPGGTGHAAFTYVPYPARIQVVSPAEGPITGGTIVVVKGVNLATATGVSFGPAAASSFVAIDDSTVVALAPPGPPGRVEVTVTTPAGPSSTDGYAGFVYSFLDVPPGAPFYDDVVWAATAGITTGYADGTFRPAGTTNRQAMAAQLYRAEGQPGGAHPTCGSAPFVDVPTSHPFCGEIAWMKSAGLATGNADGTFRPLAPVSRAAMAAFLYRLVGSPDGPDPGCAAAPFTDVSTEHPFCGEIAALQRLGIVAGYGDGGYHPAADVARGATVAFLHRVATRPQP